MSWYQRIARHPISVRQLLIAAALLPVLAFIHYAAYWLRFEGQLTDSELNDIGATIGWVSLLKVAVLGWWGVYGTWHRYVTFHDLVVLIQAATIASFLVVFANYLFLPNLDVPRSVFILDWGATVFIIGGLKSIVRFVEERAIVPFLSNDRQQVFIVGANDSGEALLRAMRRSHSMPYQAVAFITEDRSTLRSSIAGVPVIGTLDQTCQLAQRLGVSAVLITGELPGQQVRQLVEQGQRHGVAVKVLPSYAQLLRDEVDLRPREPSIEDLLRREPVALNMDELHDWIDSRVLMVTGSAGSIGAEICRQLMRFRPRKLVLVDRCETGQFYLHRELEALGSSVELEFCLADLNDSTRMQSLFEQFEPQVVFHAAAYKHVPLMEANVGEGVKNITLATRRLADLAHQYGVVSFVMISTDKAVNPTNVMGTCKRVAELYVQALSARSACRFVTVRFGNVLDSAGSVIPVFRQQIAQGGPVTVTHPEMKRFFMTICEASQLVVQAGAMGRGGEIFVLDMGAPIRIVDLAQDMIRLSGLEVGRDIEIVFTGRRPGEKLFEELLVEGERHLPTAHAKIMVVKGGEIAAESINRVMRQLEAAADGPSERVQALLREAVPQYSSEPAVIPDRERRAA